MFRWFALLNDQFSLHLSQCHLITCSLIALFSGGTTSPATTSPATISLDTTADTIGEDVVPAPTDLDVRTGHTHAHTHCGMRRWDNVIKIVASSVMLFIANKWGINQTSLKQDSEYITSSVVDLAVISTLFYLLICHNIMVNNTYVVHPG